MVLHERILSAACDTEKPLAGVTHGAHVCVVKTCSAPEKNAAGGAYQLRNKCTQMYV